MPDKEKAYPIDYHETWDVHDASKTQTFMDCPRKYFYSYVVGWAREVTSNHLVFGESWHRAMEALLQNGYNPDAIDEGMKRFTAYYRQHFGPMTDVQLHPKSPGNALEALIGYTAKYAARDGDAEVLYTEVSGTVPIAENRRVHFRLDSVLKDSRGIYCLEHKTQSRPFPSWEAWENQWTLSMQVSLYNHALHCIFPDDEVYGIIINAVFFQKKENKYVRVPVKMTPNMLNDWLWNVNHWIDMIDWNFEALSDCTEDDDTMTAFPKNTQSCNKYFGCPFADFCGAWPNPLKHLATPPQGYEVYRWDPRDRDKDATTVLNVTGRKAGQ